MEYRFRQNYKPYTDREIVDMIVTKPYNDEAAAYLIYKRYNPLLFTLYLKAYNKDESLYGDCQDDLFIYLKGKELDWNKFRTFEWRSNLGPWLKITAWNRFLEIKPKLIGKEHDALSIDDRKDGKTIVQIPDDNEINKQRLENKILLMEAVSMLKDPDQKFVIIKRLEGYNSKEIAELMQKSWEKHGIKKCNKEGKQIVPTPGFVDVKTQRAKENLKKILSELI